MDQNNSSNNTKKKYNDFDIDGIRLWEGGPAMQQTFQMESKHADNDEWLNIGKDMVNSPGHYTSGRVEAIEIIEDAVEGAPSNQTAVMQANVLKYLLRLWHKDNPVQDAEKAQWYLNRLINMLK